MNGPEEGEPVRMGGNEIKNDTQLRICQAGKPASFQKLSKPGWGKVGERVQVETAPQRN